MRIASDSYPLTWHYHFSRIVIAGYAAVLGYSVYLGSQDVYAPFLQAWRRLLIEQEQYQEPLERSQYFNETVKYEELFHQVFQGVAAILLAGAALITLNCRVVGASLCLIALGCVMVT